MFLSIAFFTLCVLYFAKARKNALKFQTPVVCKKEKTDIEDPDQAAF